MQATKEEKSVEKSLGRGEGDSRFDEALLGNEFDREMEYWNDGTLGDEPRRRNPSFQYSTVPLFPEVEISIFDLRRTNSIMEEQYWLDTEVRSAGYADERI